MPFAPPFHVDIDRAKFVYYLASLDIQARWFELYEYENRKWFDTEWINSGIALVRGYPDLLELEQNDYLNITIQHPRFSDGNKLAHEQANALVTNPAPWIEKSDVLKPAPWIGNSSFNLKIPNDYAGIATGLNLPFGLRPQASPERGLEAFRRTLARGDIGAVVQDDDGSITDIPAHYWNSDCSWQVLIHQGITAHPKIGNERLRGKIFIPYRSFDNYFSAETEYFKQRHLVVCSQQNLDLPGGVSEFLAEYGYRVTRVGEPQDKNDGYIPEYVAFMLKALNELQIRPDKKIRVEEIKHWLAQNWPPEFGEASDRKLGYMATFLRPPGDQQGGFYVENREGPKLIGAKGDTP